MTLIRALTGPVVLTTLGVLIMLDYSESIPFSRTWPVLLIVFGLCKMVEYAATRGAQPHN